MMRSFVVLLVVFVVCLATSLAAPKPPTIPSSNTEPKQQQTETQDQPKQFEDAKERLPLTQAELSEAIKDLFTRDAAVLSPERAFELLQAVDPSYEKFANRLPTELDTRRLIKFSQEIDGHCGDEQFYEDMIKAETIIKSTHRALEQYITECIRDYQEICISDETISKQKATFKEAHQEGLSIIGDIQTKVETYKRRGIFKDDQAVIQALGEVLHAKENGMYRKSSKVRETCPLLIKLASSLHSETLNPSRLSNDEIKNFPELVDVCRRLEKANYAYYIWAELQYNTDAW